MPLLVLCTLAGSPANAQDPSVQAARPVDHAARPDSGSKAAPKLTLFEPDAEILKGGYVYLSFRVENMIVLPLYSEIAGSEVTDLKPKVGHLHVSVDGSEWSWIHASTDPIYLGKLSRGAHTIKVELADASHKVFDVKTMHLFAP
jgi:hypothetical protein